MPNWLRTISTSCLLALACGGGDDTKPVRLPPTANTPLPFKTVGDRLGVWDGSRHVPMFIKGMNLGVAVPGTFAGELAATRDQYERWFAQMAALGFNAIRVYTLHYPRFYEAVRDYNLAHPEAPLYILHGIWLDEDNPSQDLFVMTNMFDEGIRELVDSAHGNITIAERFGRASGKYTADISPWILGWIIGREVAPDEVAVSNAAHSEFVRFEGSALRVSNTTPSEAWFTQRLDTLIMYEREHYGVDRPFSVSSWPTLDPLDHPSELTHSSEDQETIDFETLDSSDAPGGYFASYHAYSYYPDFMTRDPDYLSVRDDEGLNSYFGYLQHLKRHYARHPLLIAEFGVPTSWGNAHAGAANMNHGGENEEEQGRFAGRQMRNMLDANCAGGAFFAWIDEWWKRTWIVDELAFPRANYAIWHNITSPEQNFGLVAFQQPEATWKRWPKVQSDGRVASLDADVDAEFFQLRLTLKSQLESGDTLTIGVDTYGDDLGEAVLPNGRQTERRNEFALVLSGRDEAQLYVTQPYDLFGIWHWSSLDEQLYHSVPSDEGLWAPVRWQNNVREYPTKTEIEIDEVGKFVVARSPAQADIRTGVIFDGNSIRIRLPWTLLQFTDPSTRSVMDDDRDTRVRETRVSDGVAFSVHLGDQLFETQRFKWEGWTVAPKTTERLKASGPAFSAALKALPGLNAE